MFEIIKTIIVKHLKVDPASITENTNLREDLGADSLDLVEIVMEMEEQFGISIPDSDIKKIKTIGEAIKYIEQQK